MVHVGYDLFPPGAAHRRGKIQNSWIATLITSAREDEMVAIISWGRGPTLKAVSLEMEPIVLLPPMVFGLAGFLFYR